MCGSKVVESYNAYDRDADHEHITLTFSLDLVMACTGWYCYPLLFHWGLIDQAVEITEYFNRELQLTLKEGGAMDMGTYVFALCFQLPAYIIMGKPDSCFNMLKSACHSYDQIEKYAIMYMKGFSAFWAAEDLEKNGGA